MRPMAKMIPASFSEVGREAGAERAVFHALERQLSGDFTVLWSIGTLGSQPREIDFLVLHPRFGVVVIEVKGGAVTLGNPMDSRRKWTSTTRSAGQPASIKNPYHQAVGAGMSFVSDWKAHSSVGGFFAITPLVILPHTPRPSNAEAVLEPKTEHFLFENDMAVIGTRIAEMMEKAMASGEGYKPLESAGVTSIIELYGRQHVVVEPALVEPEEETAPTSFQPPPNKRPAIVKIAGLTIATSLVVALAAVLVPRLIPASPPATQPAAAVKPPASAPPKTPQTITGVPDILDTATLSVNGQRLPLTGLRPVDLPEAKAFARTYLAQAGNVKCYMAPVGGWRCISLAKGLDIAEVFALSGFAKAAANAPDFIRNAEALARENRRGVWGAS
ncbi:hypothetical protein amb4029 [Paramagnetospirillum magneticum AMB-1]|uniref:NERD domain-containing protein n=2 Tax=Paramagnetospirillum magneticum TaxID=84159 RepID=Q2VZZ2_PARM1|nr:hypothetical protein amb4029 [Paramagnetospirillum magneticum AMB-1]